MTVGVFPVTHAEVHSEIKRGRTICEAGKVKRAGLDDLTLILLREELVNR